jgi:hypothetical protein
MMVDMKVWIDVLIPWMAAQLEGTKDWWEATETWLGKTEARN